MAHGDEVHVSGKYCIQIWMDHFVDKQKRRFSFTEENEHSKNEFVSSPHSDDVSCSRKQTSNQMIQWLFQHIQTMPLAFQ